MANTVLLSGALQSKMAGNAKHHLELAQQARSILAAVAENSANFPLDSEVGDVLCSVPAIRPACLTSAPLVLPRELLSPSSRKTLHFEVQRMAPASVEYLPPIIPGEVDDSAASVMAVFEVRVIIASSGLRVEQALGIGRDAAQGQLLQLYWRDIDIDQD